MSRVLSSICVFALFVALVPAGAQAKDTSQAAYENRCGWFENPTPGNAWLTDRDGEWVIAVQGGYEAKGDWPEFPDSKWVMTNGGSYGYGCACMKVKLDRGEKRILDIKSSQAKPLSACRKDKALKEPEGPQSGD